MIKKEQNERRDKWFATTRSNLHKLVNPDGTGTMPQFNAPWREPVWILPAIYTGPKEFIDLANRMVEQYPKAPAAEYKTLGTHSGMEWNIFQSNVFSHCLHRFGKLLTPAAREVMEWHARETCKMIRGSRQPDYKFHGANDNMPMMGTCGMICAGEALNIPEALDHGIWNLQEVRRLLSRSAWMSEFNSSTYSAITLSGAAKLATYSHTPEVRELALEIEQRIWAEVLLHYHPSTFMQAGPQCRAYAVDYAGHTHSLQVLLWMAFGDIVGRDPFKSCFEPDGCEVMHFAGNPWQSIAEYCDMLDTELHIPEKLARLIAERRYPATLRGRSEDISRFDGMAAPYHTETYMEEEFSLGTVNGPLCGGEQTATCYVTYKRKPEVKSFRDAATVFFKYMNSGTPVASLEKSEDGAYEGEKFISNQSWWYSMQKKNTALLLTTPNMKGMREKPLEAESMRLSVIFPAQYGKITRSIIGTGPVREGATGESAEVVPVSVETGEVFIHIHPLIPTSLPRKAALRFSTVKCDLEKQVSDVRCQGTSMKTETKNLNEARTSNIENSDTRHPTPAISYEILDLINYEGSKRSFTREQATLILNGMVLTVEAKSKFDSLETFHRQMSNASVRDYYAMSHRNLLYQRKDVEFELSYTPDPFGVQTESIDGRTVPRPVFESNQIDVNSLPFMTGPVPPSRPFFPWESMDICWYPDFPWIIGSRGLPGEKPYSRRQEDLKKQAVKEAAHE
ncbi:MAG: hypothetical protein WC637_19190 [Victivallales bacterium]|jgi:hypothetical protein